MGEIVQTTSFEVSVLGRIEVRRGGEVVDLGTPRQRAIMAALALADGRSVGFDAIVDRVWGPTAPPTAVSTMQRYVATLRRALEPDRDAEQEPTTVVTEGAGYAFRVAPGHRDVDRFEEIVGRARTALAVIPDPLRPVAPHQHVESVDAAVGILQEALGLWRGDPYADLGDHDAQLVAERVRLHDLRQSAQELRLVGMLALGRHAEAVGDLESMTSLHPLHERWWALRSVALIRSGRQADALEGLGAMRSLLADELGVDPSPPLQQLYADILRQAPSLMWTAPATAADEVHPSVPAPVHLTGRIASSRRSSRPSAVPGAQWPFIGRHQELAVLTALFDEAAYARPALVTGEAGIGKTRLVHELARAAHERGLALAFARCAPDAPTLWPVRTVLDVLGTGDADALDGSDAGSPFGTARRVADALQRAAQSGPVLVVIEDLQWADTATLGLLEHLVTDPAPRVTLVMTRRTKDGDDHRQSRLAAAVARAGGARVDLAPLAEPAGRRLALAVRPGVPAPEEIARRSGGNPFFLTALAASGGEVTGALSDVVRARLSALDPSVRAALALASATDDRLIDPADVAALAGGDRDDAEAALDEAMRAGLLCCDLAESPRYLFEHEVVREVLRSELPARTRVRCQRSESRSPARGHRPVPAFLAERPRDAQTESPDRWSSIAELMHRAAPDAETRAS